MKTTKFGQNFLESTRGQILALLRRGLGTVEELSCRLSITDNAVRAHLLSLERDGLVERNGVRRGMRKPHFAYALTTEAEQLFPKAYSTLFNQLLTVLKQKLSADELEIILTEVARSLAEGNKSDEQRETAGGNDELIESRLQTALMTLESLGGAVKLNESESGELSIDSIQTCPFDVSVSAHPEVCRLAEIFLSEITGLNVRENCRKGSQPKCSFKFAAPQKA